MSKRCAKKIVFIMQTKKRFETLSYCLWSGTNRENKRKRWTKGGERVGNRQSHNIKQTANPIPRVKSIIVSKYYITLRSRKCKLKHMHVRRLIIKWFYIWHWVILCWIAYKMKTTKVRLMRLHWAMKSRLISRCM